MKYCNHCKKILNDTEKTYRDGICAECYHKYLLDKIEYMNKHEKEYLAENNLKNKFKKFLKGI